MAFFTLAHLLRQPQWVEELNLSIASGARSVTLGGQTVIYNTTESLIKGRNVADYEDATLERQKIANNYVCFIERPTPDTDITDPPTDPLTGKPADLNEEYEPLMPMQPGLVQELLPGQKIHFSRPPDAGTNYTDYMRTSHIGARTDAWH